MIKVEYQGWFGNNLFQYVTGLVVAKRTGLQFVAAPKKTDDFYRYNWRFLNYQDVVPGLIHDNSVLAPIVLEDSRYEVSALVFSEHPKQIVLKGHYFSYKNFKHWRLEIQEWLKFELAPWKPDPEDLVLNFRLAFLKSWNGGRLIPASWYKKIIERDQPKKIYIVTDEPRSAFLDQFQEYNPHILDLSPWDCFRVMVSANRLAMSLSSFTWWAAFLSRAERIYYPLVPDEPAHNICLKVDDQPEYNFIWSDSLVGFDEPILYDKLKKEEEYRGFPT